MILMLGGDGGDGGEEEEERLLKPGKVVKPPVASRAAVNKKLGLTQSRQARSCNGEREVLSGREEVDLLEVECRKESEDKATNILGNQSSGGELPTNVRNGGKVCISGGGGGEGKGDLGNAEAAQGGREGNEEPVDQSDHHVDVQSETRHRERRGEGKGDLGKAEAAQGGLEGNEEPVDQSDQ